MLLPSESNPYRVSREKLYLTAAGIRTRDLPFSSPTLYELSYKAKPETGCGMMVFLPLVTIFLSFITIIPRPAPGLAL